jgi:adenylate kinase
MIIAITGTPGTGKSSVSKILAKNDFEVIDLNRMALENKYLLGKDEKRDIWIIDIDELEEHIKNKYSKDQTLVIEGHLSHLLKNVDIIIILRCHPDTLRKNLFKKKWNKEKIDENIQAEILDIILCESIELHTGDKIMEIDTTDKSIEEVALIIIKNIRNGFKNMKNYKIGSIDWSEENL